MTPHEEHVGPVGILPVLGRTLILGLRTHHHGQAVDGAHLYLVSDHATGLILHEPANLPGIGCTVLRDKGIDVCTVFIELCHLFKGCTVFHQGVKDSLVIFKVMLGTFQTILDEALLVIERLALRLQPKDSLLQFGTLQEVVIAAGDSDILCERHTVLLIHATLVKATLAEGSSLHLTDELALGLQ